MEKNNNERPLRDLKASVVLQLRIPDIFLPLADSVVKLCQLYFDPFRKLIDVTVNYNIDI